MNQQTVTESAINHNNLLEIIAPQHSPLFAACFGYCSTLNLTKELKKADDEGQIIPFCMEHDLPVIIGIDTVTAGEWTALTKEIAQ
jgi:hypothetical protein